MDANDNVPTATGHYVAVFGAATSNEVPPQPGETLIFVTVPMSMYKEHEICAQNELFETLM